MKRDKLIKKLERLLEEQKKEIRPHRIEGTLPYFYECWVLDRAIRDLKELEEQK